MGGCAKKAVNSPDYCECAWGEFRKAFTDEEMSAGDMPAAKLDKVKGQVVGACASKIPEETVKDGFQKGCIGKNPEMKTYCDCTWTEFRKRFSAAELGDEGTVASDRFVAARVPVVKVCGNKMPESVSKDAFMKGCAKDPKPRTSSAAAPGRSSESRLRPRRSSRGRSTRSRSSGRWRRAAGSCGRRSRSGLAGYSSSFALPWLASAKPTSL